MQARALSFVLPWLVLAACAKQSLPNNAADDDTGAPADDGTSPTTAPPSETTGASTGGDGSESNDPTDPSAEEGDEAPRWDVGGVVDPGECEKADAGIYCKDGSSVECDGNGNVVASEKCLPNVCIVDVGCVVCLEGQYHCSGPRVMACNASADPPRWTEIEVCNPSIGDRCDGGIGECVPAQQLGDSLPTGEYYQYADFHVGSTAFNGGYDVDSFGDRIYVSGNSGSSVDVYLVELDDSDGDGQLEPNQHPDNPDETGPIEQRSITFVETIPGVTVSSSSSEIFATEDRIFVGGGSITEYVFGTPGGTPVTMAPPWASYFAQVGYDEVNGVWYASNEGMRRVFQHDAETSAWGIAFDFPNMAGDHMDGMEVVTDPNTGVPYVYVSDMTSDFIGQYKLDPNEGWVQENLFQYNGTAGSLVEGFGFGALNHFWATGGDSVYEVGGGDLATYTEPTPVG